VLVLFLQYSQSEHSKERLKNVSSWK
jgi:hypothetical protein